MLDKFIRAAFLILLGTVGSGHSAYGQTTGAGENALQQMGRAQQQHYNEVKRLGPNPTRQQLKDVETKAFSSAKEAWKKESEELFKKYEKEGSNRLIRMVTDGAIPKLTPANTTEEDSPEVEKESLAAENPQAPEKQSTSNQANKPGTEANRRVGSLGESQGADGAQYVDFGAKSPDKPERKPVVVDGIIQSK